MAVNTFTDGKLLCYYYYIYICINVCNAGVMLERLEQSLFGVGEQTFKDIKNKIHVL